MARRIKHHMSHISEHPGGRDQATAIAASECGLSKNAAQFTKESCYESQVPVGSFTAMNGIAIRGGSYKWRNTGDGYFTVYDVPLVSEWKKGDHGAPYDGTKEVLEEFVATAQERYKAGNFCATAYKRHNPDIPIDHPDFLGYVLPNRVGKYTLEKGEKWTVFGDLKLSRDGFEEAKAGRIPYVSVEIPWARRRIRGLSFQDTLTPEYEYALFTVGDEVADAATANFTVSADSIAKFMEDVEAKKEPEPKKPDSDDDEFDKRVSGVMGKHLGKYVDDHMKKNGHKYVADAMQQRGMMQANDPFPRKAQALPSEPTEKAGGIKMTDPEVAAKMTAYAGEIADLRGRLDKQDQEKIAAAFVTKAEKSLSTKILAPAIKEQIATFAEEWAAAKDGEARFDKFVEALKPSLKDKPVTSVMGSMMDGAGVDLSNPVLAKIAKDGPDQLEEAGKFSTQWHELKRRFGDRITSKEEAFVKTEMGLAKARRDGLFIESGR